MNRHARRAERARMRLGISLALTETRFAGGAAPAPSPPPAPPSPTGTATTQSAIFGRRNGMSTLSGVPRRLYTGPALANLFGPTGTRQPGLLAIRCRLNADEPHTDYANTNANTDQTVFGSGGATVSNGLRLIYCNNETSAGAAFKNRFVVQGRLSTTYLGDIDPTTGAAGSASSSRGLRTAAINPFTDSEVTIFLRMTAAGRLQLFHAVAGGELQAGDFFDHAATFGLSTFGAALTIGGQTAQADDTLPAHWQGALNDLVQVENRDVTDAEMLAWARGASAADLWGASIAGWWDLLSTAKTAGARYGALTETGTVVKRGPALRPGRGTTGKTIVLRAEGNGYTHALRPQDVQAAANGAAVRALTAPMLFRVRLTGGGTTHVQGRVLKISDGSVVMPWTRLTTTAVGDGDYSFDLPGVPVGKGYMREVWREDEPGVVIRDADDHRVGAVVFFAGQSQLARLMGVSGLTESWAGQPNATTLAGDVSVVSSQAHKATPLAMRPAGVTIIDRNGFLSPSMTALAAQWEAKAGGLPLCIVLGMRSGSGMDDFMNNLVESGTGWPFWGDNADPASGYVTALATRVNKRLTGFMMNWVTADQTTVWLAGSGPTKANELFAGIGATGSRKNFAQLGLRDAPWVIGVPATRHRNIAASVWTQNASNGWQSTRIAQRDYFNGNGVAAGMTAMVGAYCSDMHQESIGDSAHQSLSAVEGAKRFAERNATALLRAMKQVTVNIESGFTGATRSGAVLTVTAGLPNGGTLVSGNGAAPKGIEVSEDGGTTWARTGFTTAIAGGTVTLTRNTGTWAGNSRVRYLHGYPWAVGTGNSATDFAQELTDIQAFLYEDGVSGHDGGRVPLTATWTDLIAV